MVMEDSEVLANGIKNIYHRILFADGIVLKRGLKIGRKVSRKKTVYLRFKGGGNSDINLQGDNSEIVTTFKYLGATLAENGDLDAEMTQKIQLGKLDECIWGSVRSKNNLE